MAGSNPPRTAPVRLAPYGPHVAPIARSHITRDQRCRPRYAYFLFFLCFLAFVFFLVLAHPVTWILVFCLIWAPFCPVIVVGITRFCPQRLPLAFAGTTAARPECGPSGRLSSKELIGASGTLLNALLVTCFLMLMLPVSSSVIPSPCSMRTRSGNAAPP